MQKKPSPITGLSIADTIHSILEANELLPIREVYSNEDIRARLLREFGRCEIHTRFDKGIDLLKRYRTQYNKGTLPCSDNPRRDKIPILPSVVWEDEWPHYQGYKGKLNPYDPEAYVELLNEQYAKFKAPQPIDKRERFNVRWEVLRNTALTLRIKEGIIHQSLIPNLEGFKWHKGVTGFRAISRNGRAVKPAL